jgi:hypothetical protein
VPSLLGEARVSAASATRPPSVSNSIDEFRSPAPSIWWKGGERLADGPAGPAGPDARADRARTPVTLAIPPSFTAADVERLCAGTPPVDDAGVVCDVALVVVPSLATVDALARLALAARRRGVPIRLVHAPVELRELLALCGLARALPCRGAGSSPAEPSSDAASGFEAEGQPEEREVAGRVEEEHDPADPPAADLDDL